MKRFVLVSFVAAVSTSLLASPSFAVTPVDSVTDRSAQVQVAGDQGTEGSTAAIYVPADDLSKQLRDKMPYISQAPTLVGNDLVWKVNVSPMRLKAKKGVSLLDRLGGQVTISKPGVDIAGMAFESDQTGKVLFSKTLASRLITNDGDQQVSVTLPKGVAAELRSLPTSKLIHRVLVSMSNDKDTNSATPGYDRRQLSNSLVPPAIADYLASRRAAVKPGSFHRAAANLTPRSQTNTPGTIVIYNGSPFDLSVSGNAVQCQVPFGWLGVSQSTLASNTSMELFGVSQVQGSSGTSYWYSGSTYVNAAAQQPSKRIASQALSSITEGGLVDHITDNFAAGLSTAFSSFAKGLVLDGVFGMMAALSSGNNQCIDAGSAMTFAWTNVSLGANQATGNVDYWIPNYGRNTNMMGVPPTSIPAVAPGSPLNAYNATSANGLAVSPAVLQRELGLGGTITLATQNTGSKGAAVGSDCVYTNQQVGNPSSSNPNSQYGSTSLGGGSTADWGPCVNTTVSTNADYNDTNYFVSGPGNNLMNRGVTLMVGYSTTAYATAGPSPAQTPTTATSATACVRSTAPCAYLALATDGTPPVIGCTPGTWNMLTPWSGTNPSMNLSSPPSAYNASSVLNTQIGFTGVTATGSQVTRFAPANVSGSVTSSFSPSAVNTWQLSPANLAAIQQALGGAGGYVTQWLCVMTAKSSIPSGIPASSTAMNLGWYGVPVIVPIANPAGNVVSPPS